MRSASAGGIIAALLTPAAAASFFRFTSRSDGTTRHTVAGVRHQGLQQPRGLDTERLGRLQPDALCIRIVAILMQLECNARLGQRERCGSPLGHAGPSITPQAAWRDCGAARDAPSPDA